MGWGGTFEGGSSAWEVESPSSSAASGLIVGRGGQVNGSFCACVEVEVQTDETDDHSFEVRSILDFEKKYLRTRPSQVVYLETRL